MLPTDPAVSSGSSYCLLVSRMRRYMSSCSAMRKLVAPIHGILQYQRVILPQEPAAHVYQEVARHPTTTQLTLQSRSMCCKMFCGYACLPVSREGQYGALSFTLSNWMPLS